MTNKELSNILKEYLSNAKIKILVDGKEQDIRCIIPDNSNNTIILADATYSS